jgi:hypothetical protein
MGALATRVNGELGPIAAAIAADTSFGTTRIQDAVDIEKYRLLGIDAPAVGDEGTLDPIVQVYLAKKAALALMPAAYAKLHNAPISVQIDQHRTETETFVDPLRALEKLQAQLLVDIATLESDVAVIVTPVVRSIVARPAVSDGSNSDLITIDPWLVGRAFNPAAAN